MTPYSSIFELIRPWTELSGPFIISVLELRLDTNTMFEWQNIAKKRLRYPLSKSSAFFNLHAQDLEVHISEQSMKIRIEIWCIKKAFTSSKPITSFAGATEPVDCSLCKSGKHFFVCLCQV